MDALDSRVAERPLDVEQILEDLIETFAGPGYTIRLACERGLGLSSRQCELVRRIALESLDHAVRHRVVGPRPAIIWVNRSQERGRAHLAIRDNGPGFPELNFKSSRGRDLVCSLAEELGGFARFDNRNYGGAEVSVTFPIVPAASADQ